MSDTKNDGRRGEDVTAPPNQPGADTPATKRSPAEDAIQRPGAAATGPTERVPKEGQRWSIPIIAAGAAIVVLLLIVFL
ncbi:hypothetical protein [Roseitranquillus sediminis]|uniref:hypothetical protein n=1 Tax=Roseitranquillus sediminis TaxID=2809051 RepID=UPI001D0C2B9E|nr:hypothetical protein [Roseitranquillus sediminis]MBM9594837.1 hypothetical protein [Roseitranquillus sediminis]